LASNRIDTECIETESVTKGALVKTDQNEEKTMKKRWMKNIIETSSKSTPALPFQRAVRYAARTQMQPVTAKSA